MRYLLFLVLIGFAIIEILALWVGTHLTQTVTGAVAHLYDATRHINRGDFGHRVPVRSQDQLSTLGNSFNSMAESLQKLIEEQKQKQRLENELVIAQEVQAQLFPRQISQLPTLELHGFCRPPVPLAATITTFCRLIPTSLYWRLAMSAEREFPPHY